MGTPFPGITGQNYTLDDFVQALINAGVTDFNKLVTLTAITSRENTPNSQGVANTNNLNDYEAHLGVNSAGQPVAAAGPLQYINNYHPTYDALTGLQNLQYTANYVAQHQAASNDYSPWAFLASGQAAPLSQTLSSGQMAMAQAAVQRVSTGQGQYLVFAGGAAPQQTSVSLPSKALSTLQSITTNVGNAIANTFVPQGTKLVAPGAAYNGDAERYLFLSNLNPANLGADALAFMRAYEASHSTPSGGRNAPRLDATAALGEPIGATLEPIAPTVEPLSSQPVITSSPVYIQGLGGPFGNQTSINNVQAVVTQQNVLGYQQAATANPRPIPATSQPVAPEPAGFTQGDLVAIASAGGGFAESNFQPA